ncbi:hypothetical protein SAMD00019534_026780, partial [Acytostelium subglobosum LB1]|uniref:hypothetical protein n=1 Tax=Acytostelium subglobosum LB1 TaxID=1410327 RepID=UPI000644A80E
MMESIPERNGKEVIIEKSPNDKNEYRHLVLENGMKVVLILDPKAELAAAAMVVQVGSLSNPDDYPGLAHFLEHMLFLGTERYPVEKEFTQFITMNGGHSNAETHKWFTNFYFKVRPACLEEALDRFSSFFVSPLFTESATSREINAVDSEHHANRQSDVHQLYSAILMCFAGHPVSRFDTGSLATLNDRPGLRERMIAFYDQFYSANIMSLALVSPAPLDTQEVLARQYFGNIVNKNIKTPNAPDLVLGESVQVFGVPVKDTHLINFTWPVPRHLAVDQVYDDSPWQTIGHLLGHESKGSLLSFLKSIGWAYDLSAAIEMHDLGITMFSIRITVTPLGIKHADQVAGHLYNYLQMITHSELPDYVHKEIKFISDMNWNNLPRFEPIGLVKNLSRQLATLTEHPEHMMRIGSMVPETFNKTRYRQAVDSLTFDKMSVVQFSKTFEHLTDKVEEHYGFKYSMRPVTADQLIAWKSMPKSDRLHFTKENQFIPSSITIKASQTGEQVLPQVVYNEDNIIVEWSPDHMFNTPNAIFVGRLESSYMKTVHETVQVFLFNLAVKSILNDDVLYNATMCLMHFAMDIEVICSGYDNKLATLALEVFKHLNKFDISEEQFNLTHQHAMQLVSNIKFTEPLEYGNRFVLRPYVVSTSHSIKDQYDALKTITRLEFIQFIRRYIQSLNVRWLVMGNVTKDDAVKFGRDFATMVDSRTGTRSCDVMIPRSVMFEAGVEYHIRQRVEDPAQGNSVSIFHYQCGVSNIENATLGHLLAIIMDEEADTELRTNQQLGYIVFATCTVKLAVVSFSVEVQSNTKDADYLQSRINEFVNNQFPQFLDKMPQAHFDSYVKGYQTRLQRKRSNLMELAKDYMDLRSNYFGDYQTKTKMVDVLSKVTKNDLINFHKIYLVPNDQRRLLVLSLFGYGHEMKELDTKSINNPRISIINDPTNFKQLMGQYPAIINPTN